jgi:ABC-type transport system involved in cytochrome c biogenesis permease subunit
VHPKTSVVPTLLPSMRGPLLFCIVAFFCLYAVLLALRTTLETRRARLEALYAGMDD